MVPVYLAKVDKSDCIMVFLVQQVSKPGSFLT